MILYICQKKKYDIKECLKDFCLEKNLDISRKQIEETEICLNNYGKPYFNNLGVRFSVSHSGRFWACMMGLANCGFDMEDMGRRRNNNFQALAKRFFTQNEYEYVKTHGATGFIDIWIRKEAYVKYLGIGLSYGLDKISLVGSDGRINDSFDGVTFKKVVFNKVDISNEIEGVYCNNMPEHLEKIKIMEI